MHCDRVEQLDSVRVQGLGQANDILREWIGLIIGLRYALHDGDAREHHCEITKRGPVRQAPQREVVGNLHHHGGLCRGERFKQAHEMPLVNRAEHPAHGFLGQVASAVGNGLVGQRERIAHRSGGRLTEQAQRRHLERDLLLAKNLIKVPDDGFARHLLEVELQATRQHGHRNLLGIGGGQNELHMRGRLFEGLEHRVERVAGEHMHFIDHVDLEATRARRVDRLLEQLGHFIDAPV